MQPLAAGCVALCLKRRERRSSADRRSAMAADYDHRERRERRLAGGLETLQHYSTAGNARV